MDWESFKLPHKPGVIEISVEKKTCSVDSLVEDMAIIGGSNELFPVHFLINIWS